LRLLLLWRRSRWLRLLRLRGRLWRLHLMLLRRRLRLPRPLRWPLLLLLFALRRLREQEPRLRRRGLDRPNNHS
jgi:hypothetical protein